MDPDHVVGSPWAEMLAGASVVHQQAIESLAVPALILDLPTRRVRAANQAFANLIGVPVADMLGHPNDEVIAFDHAEEMRLAVAALYAHAIDGYRARRDFTAGDGTCRHVQVWCRAVDLDGVRSAVYIVYPVPGPGEPRIDAPVGWGGALVVGKADAQWHVQCVSSDLFDLVGFTPEECVGKSLLGAMHPDDVGDLLAAVTSSPVEGATARHVRVRHRDSHWVPVQCLFVRLSGEPLPPLVFALLPDPARPTGPDRLADIEDRLRRIAGELRATGFMEGIEKLPTMKEFPQLARLSSRQWQILARLLRGERVPTIARELYVSPGTVRNHLTAIFERFGVHSQADLIAALRPR